MNTSWTQRCDRCGAHYQSLHCKLSCDNCGARLDCSDLFIDWDQVKQKRPKSIPARPDDQS